MVQYLTGKLEVCALGITTESCLTLFFGGQYSNHYDIVELDLVIQDIVVKSFGVDGMIPINLFLLIFSVPRIYSCSAEDLVFKTFLRQEFFCNFDNFEVFPHFLFKITIEMVFLIPSFTIFNLSLNILSKFALAE